MQVYLRPYRWGRVLIGCRRRSRRLGRNVLGVVAPSLAATPTPRGGRSKIRRGKFLDLEVVRLEEFVTACAVLKLANISVLVVHPNPLDLRYVEDENLP